jgi:hypothetical protein
MRRARRRIRIIADAGAVYYAGTMRLAPLFSLALLALAAPAVGSRSGAAQSGDCPVQQTSPAFAASVAAALEQGRDVWGEQLLRSPGGPTYSAARRFLVPLLLGIQRGARPLTASGVYYVPFSSPPSVYSPLNVALHVADGSQIISRRLDGPSLTVYVGADGRERFGSCLARLGRTSFAGGWMPILETSYRDAGGVRYRQESFVARVPASSAIASYVQITVDAQAARQGRPCVSSPLYGADVRPRPARGSSSAPVALRAPCASASRPAPRPSSTPPGSARPRPSRRSQPTRPATTRPGSG